MIYTFILIPSINDCHSPCLFLSGGFALLASTGTVVAGVGGAGAGAAVGALSLGGVVTGLIPLVAAGSLGVLGRRQT